MELVASNVVKWVYQPQKHKENWYCANSILIFSVALVDQYIRERKNLWKEKKILILMLKAICFKRDNISKNVFRCSQIIAIIL